MALRSYGTAAVSASADKVFRFKYLPRLMGKVLRKTGWTPRKDAEDDNWTLFWKNGRLSAQELAEATLPQHTLNHFPETFHLTKKGHLQFMLKSARIQYGEIFDFFPRSHVFTHHSKDLLSQYFDRPGRLWIGKPAASSQGRGIHITKSLKDFAKYLAPLPSPKAPSSQSALKQKTENVSISAAEGDKTDVTAEPATKKGRDVVIVQEYIKNPLLVGGYKHDLRIYVLVTSFRPLRAYLYLDGLARFCTRTYSTTDLDLLRHLTNTSIHTKVFGTDRVDAAEIEQFRKVMTGALGDGDLSKWRLRSLLAHFRNSGIDHEAVWNSIRNVIRLSLLPLAREMKAPKPRCFELFGFDIMLTDDLKAKLIEVNLAPSLGVECFTDLVVKEPMIVDLLDIVFEKPESPIPFPRRIDPISGPDSAFTEPFSRGDYELLFPFDQETLEASTLMAANVNPDQNMTRIIEAIGKQYKQNLDYADLSRSLPQSHDDSDGLGLL